MEKVTGDLHFVFSDHLEKNWGPTLQADVGPMHIFFLLVFPTAPYRAAGTQQVLKIHLTHEQEGDGIFLAQVLPICYSQEDHDSDSSIM